MEENIFVICKLLEQQKNWNTILEIALKLLRCLRRVYILNSKTIKKTKSPFMVHANFESILVPEDNGKQNPNDFYTNKYQKYVACSYGYKFLCVDNKFSKPFKSYSGGRCCLQFC